MKAARIFATPNRASLTSISVTEIGEGMAQLELLATGF
jgi:hypothetical protein